MGIFPHHRDAVNAGWKSMAYVITGSPARKTPWREGKFFKKMHLLQTSLSNGKKKDTPVVAAVSHQVA